MRLRILQLGVLLVRIGMLLRGGMRLRILQLGVLLVRIGVLLRGGMLLRVRLQLGVTGLSVTGLSMAGFGIGGLGRGGLGSEGWAIGPRLGRCGLDAAAEIAGRWDRALRCGARRRDSLRDSWRGRLRPQFSIRQKQQDKRQERSSQTPRLARD